MPAIMGFIVSIPISYWACAWLLSHWSRLQDRSSSLPGLEHHNRRKSLIAGWTSCTFSSQKGSNKGSEKNIVHRIKDSEPQRRGLVLHQYVYLADF